MVMVGDKDCQWWQLQGHAEQKDRATKDPELKKYCKTPKIKGMGHETLYLCCLNMISSWNISITGAVFRGVVNNGSPSQQLTYNHSHNILRLFDVLPNFSFTTSETMHDYYI